ncbi:BURP domain-containing protein [Prunus dulcis]|uniref:BURP domain-containing protein n=1 Tax=Prunus dulcis TaxID=3755 RepID=A0A4Y1QU66_PRUDU|nr:BURP domain-containing protein [Prunus dulcis]
MLLTLVASHAALPPQLYWNSVLPNTQMPKSISELLQPGHHCRRWEGRGECPSREREARWRHQRECRRQRRWCRVTTGKPGGGTNVGVGKGGVAVNTGHKGKPVYVGVKPGPNPFDYEYAATETQLHGNRNAAIFFSEKDIRPGTSMTLTFSGNSNTAAFVPRKTADSIPFSSNKLPEIFSQFSVKPESVEADIIKGTIEECESSGIRGEEKYCATSLESMVDFSTSKLGGNIQAISTEAEKGATLQKYTIIPGVKKLAAGKSVVCHKQTYPYAVFYCHATKTTRAYVVPLKGADGLEAKAVAVCHTDTSEWNPKHLAFQVLKVKPGTVPVCHFLPKDHIVWVPKKST